jgi:putative ABC transport system substrate-binding protein
MGDPAALGLVRSIPRPGGNITGVMDFDLELAPKRLEVFRELIPDLKRVLFVYDSTARDSAAAAVRYREAARRLQMTLVERPVRTEQEAREALTMMVKSGIDGMLGPSEVALNIPGLVLEAAEAHRLPTMYTSAFMVERGALAAYGPDFHASGRQSARMVDKLLKGAKPADIPVESNSEIEFVLNLKVAEALGLTLTPHTMFRANRLVR